MNLKKIIAGIFVCLAVVAVSAQTPAFPGAEGGGMYTTGGRGGKVYYVNTLEDNESGNSVTREGSLRWCLKQSGAKMILFKVSGVIELTKTLEIKGDVTIAGQTSPGKGICLKNYEAVIKGGNVIIRFMRFRPGNDFASAGADGIWGRYQENIILDHCTMGWAVDECASFYANKNFTMQWCILHEGLMNSGHPKGIHSYGGLWGGLNATFHHNLLIHNNSRNPRFNGYKRSGLSYNNPQDDEIMDFRNNVLYNWGDNSGYGGEAAGKYNVVNNYYRPGNATSSGSKARIIQIDKDGGTTVTPVYGTFYVSGNVMHGNSTVTNDNTKGITNNSGTTLSMCTTKTPFECTSVTTHTAEEAYAKVLDYAGASLSRDTVERRLIREARTGVTTFTGSVTKRKGLIDTPSDAEGWELLDYHTVIAPTDTDIDGIPDGWLDANYPGKLATDLNEDGYTYLEVYLNSLVKDLIDSQTGTAINPETIDKKGSLYIVDNVIYAQAKKLEIFSLDGKIVALANDVDQLYIGGLKTGIYLVRIIDNQGNITTHKFVK